MGAHHSREIINKEKRRRRKKSGTTITSTNNGSNNVLKRSLSPISSALTHAHIAHDDKSIDRNATHPANQSDICKDSTPPASASTSTSPNLNRNPVSPVRHQVVLSDHIMPLSSLMSITRNIRRSSHDENNDNLHPPSDKQSNNHNQKDSGPSSVASDDEASTHPSSSSRSAFYRSSLDSSSTGQTSLTQPNSILHRRLSLTNNRSSLKTNSKASNSNRSSNSGPVIFDTTVNSTDPIPSYSPDDQSHSQHEPHLTQRRVRKSSWVYDCSHEKEYNRQLREHYVLKQVFGKKMMPELNPAPRHILDSACGIGLWTWETSQQYTNSDVVGIDINLPDKHSGPWGSSATNTIPLATHTNGDTSGDKNISFVHADILEPLPFENDYFGFIHQRGAGTFVPFDYWETLLREFYRILKEDGVLQLVEHDILFKNPGPILSMINEWYRIASDGIGVQTGYNQVMKEKLLSVGFDQVEEEVYDIPIGEWSDDPVKKQHGFLYKEQVKALFKSVQRWWLAETGITQHEYDRVCSEAMDEFEHYNSSVTWKIFTARKPRACFPTSGQS